MRRAVTKHLLSLFIVLSAVLAAGSSALKAGEGMSPERLQFSRIWEMVKKNSPSQKAAVSEAKAAEIQKNRQGRHWLPRVYADGSGYVTNDPGLTFMSNMGERSVVSEDFIPENLNRPGTNFYQKGTVGIELPVYEGGAGVENAKAAEKIAEAKRYQRDSVYLDEFSSTASAYGRIIVLMRTAEELKQLQNSVSAVLSNYQGGLRSNPVEYSGILGLKALKNRITALTAENDSKIASLRDYIEKMSGSSFSAGWIPSDADAVVFADSYLKNVSAGRDDRSYRVKTFQAIAESAKSRAEAEKSIFLPKVGLFSEVNIYSGERDTADSYTAGFYIRMNIVSPTEYGAVKQAELESEAARSRARNAGLKDEIELQRLLRFSETLKSNIKILNESMDIMDEQVRNSGKLFARGSIKSFQLADVFARQTDLVMNLAGAEEEYINVRSGIYNYSGRADEEVSYDKK